MQRIVSVTAVSKEVQVFGVILDSQVLSRSEWKAKIAYEWLDAIEKRCNFHLRVYTLEEVWELKIIGRNVE